MPWGLVKDDPSLSAGRDRAEGAPRRVPVNPSVRSRTGMKRTSFPDLSLSFRAARQLQFEGAHRIEAEAVELGEDPFDELPLSNHAGQ